MRNLLLVLASACALHVFGAPFERNATVVFLGDSITHQARWTGYVTRYYTEWMPERNVTFYNAGVGGDTTGACQCRLHEDVNPHSPDVIVTMFGMNDVGGALWAESFGEKEQARKKQVLARYEANLGALAARLKADNPKARLVWCTPSIYDETAAIERANNPGRNRELLAGCAEIVKRFASARGEEVVDFHGPMTAFNAEKQKQDPAFTLVGPDRVHPLAPGAFFMAREFLRQQGLDPKAADPLTPWSATAVSRKIGAALAAEDALRGMYAERWFLRQRKIDPDDLAAVWAFADRLKAEGRTGYFEGLLPRYLEQWPGRAAAWEKFRRLRDEAKAAAAPYIPEPQPVATKDGVEVTAVYYPGTDWMCEWNMVEQVYPQIRPLLGWYDEGHPENIDWQIKWAVEHGVTSFLVDWYWCKGVQRMDHWVKAFPKAKFAKRLKWYLNWCNHNEPGAHSVADQTAATKWWIDHYFREDFYYKDAGGRPLVVVWDWTNLENDFRAIAAANGETDLPPGEGLKRALDLSRKLAREAGLPGIRFACFANGGRPKPEQMAALRHAGIEELFQYNYAWPSQVRDGLPPARRKEWEARPNWWKAPWRYDFAWSREASHGWWTRNWDAKDIPLWPTLATGWNSTPRDFGAANAVTNRTVAEFRKVCEEAKRFCAETGCRRVVVGPMNEWQEGSYIEPNAEFGFEMYDALRDVFCEKPAAGWPANLAPADIGRPNPQFPPMPFFARTSWDFADGHQGWYRNPYGTQTIWAHDGEIEFFRTFAKRTPVAIRTRPKPFAAAGFGTFKVRMRLTPNLGRGDLGKPKGDEVVRLMWGRAGHPILQKDGSADVSAQASVPSVLDGAWHEYALPLAGNPSWNGTVDELWFDPSDLMYVNAEIDWMRFE